MPPDPTLLDRLLDANRDAFEAAQYEVAFHALAAALHAADDLKDLATLRHVQRTARDQGAWIDAHAPEHRLSPQSAEARRTHTRFSTLAGQADAKALIREHARRTAQRH